MIEKTVLDFLKTQLNVPVFTQLPEVPSSDYPTFPENFVVIEKVGGSMRDQINIASIAIQSYSTKSLLNAAELDEAVRTVIPNILENEDISGFRLSSNYNHSDARTKRFRYQCVYEFYY